MYYIPLKEQLYHKDIGNYQSFGICVYARRADGWCEVMRISDVSVELDFVIGLCEKCNRMGISPIHLSDVVMDSL